MTLQELLVDELKDLYSAENQLVKALPKIAKGAASPELKTAVQTHLEETKGQVERLKQIFEIMAEKPKGQVCKAMQGLVEEGQEQLEKETGDNVGDLGLIGACLRVEHYEIAAYTTAIAMAKTLGHGEVVSLLSQTLSEESQTGKKLEQLAKPILKQAKTEGLAEDEEEEMAVAGSGRR